MQKFTLALLVLALAASMSVPAFAATGYGPGTVEDTTVSSSANDDDDDDDDDDDAYVPSSGSSSGATSGSAGSSATSGSSTPAPATAATVQNAVRAALSSSSNRTGKVTLRNVTTVSAKALQDAVKQLQDAGKTNARVHVDRVEGNAVVSRVYVTPEITAQLSGDIDLSVSVDEKDTAATKNVFEKYFTNEVAVVSLGQKGAYGADIPMAVKVDLSKLNTETLVFYSYDKATGKYTAIEAPDYRIDANGYLHFSTPVGGDIVITDKALQAK